MCLTAKPTFVCALSRAQVPVGIVVSVTVLISLFSFVFQTYLWLQYLLMQLL